MEKNKGSILIIDDNEEILFSLEIFLSKYFEKIKIEKNPELLLSLLDREKFDVVILDMNFSASQKTGNEGFFWMRKILNKDPSAIIIFITAFPGIELAVKAIKEGATDFIEKPWENGKLLTTVINSYKLGQSKLELNKLKEKQKYLIDNINESFKIVKGNSGVMKSVYSTIEKVSDTDANILILGENGTGKELIAREIHNKSKRSTEAFVSVDVASLSESLFESELFGHTKGAFTDAKKERKGRFELASGGTLFLDEIGNLSLAMQAKLLTSLQNRVITPLGSNNNIPIDIRLICATNKDLFDMVENELFREDLLYRINTVLIDLPPLRRRKADIPVLIDTFLQSYKKRYNKPELQMSESAIIKLVDFNWPGNVRQLKNTIENAVILAESKKIGPGDFVRIFSKTLISKTSSKNYYSNEKTLIQSALKENNGHLSKTANELGIARTTLYRKIKKYGLKTF
ncbi:sigma-54-dependent transcriptional regulator [Bacteroidota bacterium]